jgi:hypothetical protein
VAASKNDMSPFLSVPVDAEAESDKGGIFIKRIQHPGSAHAFDV